MDEVRNPIKYKKGDKVTIPLWDIVWTVTLSSGPDSPFVCLIDKLTGETRIEFKGQDWDGHYWPYRYKGA